MPCSPARAASIAAFNAKRFVCSAIPLIVFVILFIELITRRKVPDKVVGAINYVGFMILMGLMALVTLKDIIFPVQL